MFFAVAYIGRRTVSSEDQRVWISVGGDNGTNKAHIFRSLDHGQNWDKITLTSPPPEGVWFQE